MTGVLAADDGGRREHLGGPPGEIGEVADRRRDDDEFAGPVAAGVTGTRRAGHSLISSSSPTTSRHRSNAPASASRTARACRGGRPIR